MVPRNTAAAAITTVTAPFYGAALSAVGHRVIPELGVNYTAF